MRKLARIEKVESLTVIEGADAIELARVGGWNVVVRKGEFAVGDLGVYFEIDALLPESDPRFAAFCARGVRETLLDNGQTVRGHVLRTAKLRGVVSQGLLMPVTTLGVADAALGSDVASRLGIIKFEPPLPAGGSGDQVGPSPTHLAPKTDAERIQNLTAAFATLQAHSAGWIATEKIDGTSLTFAIDLDGKPVVASRNWLIADSSNMYWDSARPLLSHMQPGMAVQAEIFGEAVQSNPLKIRGRRIAVFNIAQQRVNLARSQWPAWALEQAVPELPLSLPATVAEAIAQADGVKSLVSPGQLAEGIVWQARDGFSFPELEGRHQFKVISNKWLLKHG
jgi:RNA ligase (TIGR02306 family)